MPGRGKRCERARPLLFLSPAATSAAEPLKGKRAGCQPLVASISGPLGSLLGPVTSLCGRGHLLLSFPPCYPGPALLVPELPAVTGSPPPPSPHASEGPRPPCRFLKPGAREEDAWNAAFALAPHTLSGPAAAAGVSTRAGPRWSPELAPSPRPPKFASLLFRGGGSAPRGGRWLGLLLGVWRPPGLGRLLEA